MDATRGAGSDYSSVVSEIIPLFFCFKLLLFFFSPRHGRFIFDNQFKYSFVICFLFCRNQNGILKQHTGSFLRVGWDTNTNCLQSFFSIMYITLLRTFVSFQLYLHDRCCRMYVELEKTQFWFNGRNMKQDLQAFSLAYDCEYFFPSILCLDVSSGHKRSLMFFFYCFPSISIYSFFPLSRKQ